MKKIIFKLLSIAFVVMAMFANVNDARAQGCNAIANSIDIQPGVSYGNTVTIITNEYTATNVKCYGYGPKIYVTIPGTGYTWDLGYIQGSLPNTDPTPVDRSHSFSLPNDCDLKGKYVKVAVRYSDGGLAVSDISIIGGLGCGDPGEPN